MKLAALSVGLALTLTFGLSRASAASSGHRTLGERRGPLPALPSQPDPMPSADTRETVLLLHGLGLNRLAMTRLACALERDGYRVINVSYPSRSVPLEKLAADWLPATLRAQKYLRDHTPPHLGRIVMLAPPNHGSEVADRLRDNPVFRLFTGVNGHRLGTAADSLPRQLGPLDADLGIIAGDRSLNPLFSAWIGAPSDGKVSVESTRLAGMRDHLVVPISHTWLQWRGPVIEQIKTYLRTGKFTHATSIPVIPPR